MLKLLQSLKSKAKQTSRSRAWDRYIEEFDRVFSNLEELVRKGEDFMKKLSELIREANENFLYLKKYSVK